MTKEKKSRFESFLHYFHDKKDYVIPHRHSGTEIIFYCRGEGRTTINEATYPYVKNTLAVVEPGCEHDDFAQEDTEVFCVVLGDGEKLLKNAVVYEDGENRKIFVGLSRAFHALTSINRESERSSTEGFEDELNLIVLLVMQLFTKKQSDQKAYIRQMIEWTTGYLKANYRYNLKLEIIAENLGYSYDRFRHIFKEYTGGSVYQYLSGLRLSGAKELLAHTGQSIAVIARNCGFKSAVRFSAFFKEKTGMAPHKYRGIVRAEEYREGVYNEVKKDKVYQRIEFKD